MLIFNVFPPWVLLGIWLLGLVLFLGLWWYLGKRSRKGLPPLPHRWESGVDELDGVSLDAARKGDGGSDDSGLMGRSVPDEGVVEVQASDFGFAGKGSGGDGSADQVSGRDDQLGLLADVQQEIKEVCRVLSEQDGNKSDFFSMMELVKAEFPAIVSHPLRASLSGFIREHVPFAVSDSELEEMWL